MAKIMEIATLIALARNDNFMIYSSFPLSVFRFLLSLRPI